MPKKIVTSTISHPSKLGRNLFFNSFAWFLSLIYPFLKKGQFCEAKPFFQGFFREAEKGLPKQKIIKEYL
ncbi:MAG: hypothetical protein Q8N60_01345 [Candidatus Diapherotrites archaeon]|nr:hypothetical protein [Candidatus Diapherotrites archaeon]